VRNLRDTTLAVAELRRWFAPEAASDLEFFRPARPRLFWMGCVTNRLLPILGWAISGDRAGLPLPARVDSGFVTRAEFEAQLRAVGFAEVRGHQLFPGGIASLVEAR